MGPSEHLGSQGANMANMAILSPGAQKGSYLACLRGGYGPILSSWDPEWLRMANMAPGSSWAHLPEGAK